MEACIKQSEQTRTRSIESAKRLHQEFAPVKAEVDRLRQACLGKSNKIQTNPPYRTFFCSKSGKFKKSVSHVIIYWKLLSYLCVVFLRWAVNPSPRLTDRFFSSTAYCPQICRAKGTQLPSRSHPVRVVNKIGTCHFLIKSTNYQLI